MDASVKTKQRLFIYDRKEIIVLILLGSMVALFTFTLGVHLGKRVGKRAIKSTSEDTPMIHPLADQTPNRQEFTERAKEPQRDFEKEISQELHNEVIRTGLKIDIPRQVDLPEKPKSLNGGATSLESTHSERYPQSVSKPRPQRQDNYTLQIGSHASLEEAKNQVTSISSQTELKPFLHEVELKGKGKWYRVYVGQFPSRTLAEKAGEKFRSQHQIASFVVAKVLD